MDTQTQIERLIELAIVQRTELKELVAQLPQLREHLSTEIEKAFDEAEPQLRAELEEWTTKQAADKTAALGVTLEAKIGELSKNLEISTQARYNAIIAERDQNARLAAEAEAKIAEHAASLPSAVKEIVSAELARFPRAGEIDQLRKEFAEPRGLNPRGKWQAGETYNRLDLVTVNGDSFVSNIDGNKERPSRNATNWTLNAARGMGGGSGFTSLNNVLGDPSAGQIVGSEGGQYVRKTLVAGANITINETANAITIIGDEGLISLNDGTAASPALFFTNDTDTGIYRPAANTLGVAVGGAQIAYFDANGITTVGAGATFDGSVHAANGNANNPSLSFTSDQDTGFFRHQPNEIGIALGGTQKATLTSTTFTITPNLVVSGTGSINGTSIPASKTLVVTTDKLSALASTSSSELAGVISDETGTGSLVFANTPTLVTPVIGAATGTSLTVTGNVTSADSILGSSGPSTKSSLSARAPRQGLVFDGTNKADHANITLGTGDFTVAAWVNPSSLSTIQGLFGGPDSSFYLQILTNGTLEAGKTGVASLAGSTAAVVAGKSQLVTYRRSGTTSYYGINGVEEVGPTNSQNYTSANNALGYNSVSAPRVLTGTLSVLIYNRALSASEVVALYEAGAPSGADYNSASNTAINTSAFTNDGTFGLSYGTFSGASATGFTAAQATATAGMAEMKPALSAKVGKRYRVSFTATLTSGQAPTFQTQDGSGNLCFPKVTVTDGANSFEVTLNSFASGTLATSFYTSNVTSYAISGFSMVPLGLLLAPDAAQAGGGLTWYDTSGNAANISWTSGVSWNVPTSGNIAANANQNVTITTSGTGRLVVPKESSAVSDYTAVFGTSLASSTGSDRVKVCLGNPDGNSELSIGQSGGNNMLLGWSYNATAASAYGFLNSYAGSNRLVLQGDGGNVLIGTTTDGGQKLQVNGEILSSPSGAGYLVFTTHGSKNTGLYYNGSQGLVLYTNTTTALTLDSSQNATFAKTVTAQKLVGTGVDGSISAADIQLTGKARLVVGLTGSSANYYDANTHYFRQGDGAAAALTLSASTATFAGSIAIGNTVQTAVAVASTHKVTISIGGSTYYLLATNV